jgi:glycosyltransferase involved in cell wall biosynthesis
VARQYLLFVGTAQPRKGLDVLLAAQGATVGAHRCSRLGPEVPVRNPERVLRTGYLPEVDLRRVLTGAAALVLPPSSGEGFGLPVPEALTCGIAVIATDAPDRLRRGVVHVRSDDHFVDGRLP